MYRLLTWSLLTFVPLTGMRMVCIEPPATADASAADCDQFCLRSAAPKADAERPNVNCVLVAGCSLLVSASMTAVLPAQTTMRGELVTSTVGIEVSDGYLAPVLAHTTPPPEV